jgi:hypothetical protein
MTPVIAERRDRRTLLPFEKSWISHGPTFDDSGPRFDPLSSLTAPVTLIVDAARTSTCPLRATSRLQKLYVPPARMSVPGPEPPPETVTSP